MTDKKYLISLILNFLIIVLPGLLLFGAESMILAYLIIWIIISIPTVLTIAVIRKSKDVLSIISFASGVPIFICGLLFRLMHWPGGALQTYSGATLLLLSLTSFILSKRKNTAGK